MAFDAVLLLSFGGPEGPDDVMPFLHNVVRGRPVPAERLRQVADQYLEFGGVSPINAQNRALRQALVAALAAQGSPLPVYWGNRNWKPFLVDTVRTMRDDGVVRAAAFVTSAFSSYSGCRQYLDDIESARASLGPTAPEIVKLRPFFNHPGFIGPLADGLRAARLEAGPGAPVLLTAHSIPVARAGTCSYEKEVKETARLVTSQAGEADSAWSVVFQSRSGPTGQPWLEPDVNDALAALPGSTSAAIVAPIGFVSDHMEVVYDLDRRAAATASDRGIKLVRSATPGTHPDFVRMICQLIEEADQPECARLLSATWDRRPAPAGRVAVRRRPAGRFQPVPVQPHDAGQPDAALPGEAGLEALRIQTIRELDHFLERRHDGSRVGVLGAGSDDLESGRRYLGQLASGGYAVPSWPRAHGGMGLGPGQADAVRSALRQFDSPDMYPFLVGLDLIGPTILAHADSEQQARWLPRIRSGEDIWCQMFSEPDAGSDLAGLKAKAVRDGDGWRVSGSKVWTSRAHYSEWGLLLARHDSSVPKHQGITAFGLDMATSGVTVKPLVQMNRDAHFNEVFLDEVWIPDSDRVGGIGEGWRVGLTCLSFERGALGGDLGVKVEQLERLRGLIPDGDAVARDRWAARMVDFKIIQMTGLRAQEARKAGKAPGPEDSGSKLRGTAMIKRLAQLGLQLEGAAATVGADDPDEWQSLFLMSPSLSIRGGTDEIQRNILGERVLGLPTEPRVDKDRPFSDTV